MHAKFLYKLLLVLQFVTYSQHSHVQEAKQRIRSEVRSALGTANSASSSSSRHHYHQHHQSPSASASSWRPEKGRVVHRVHKHRNRWSGGRRRPIERHHFSTWSGWSPCGADCVKRRERYCRAKRKCANTKHVEEQKCRGCHPEPVWQPIAHYEPSTPTQVSAHHAIIINAAASSPQHPLLLSLPNQSPPPPPPPAVHIHQIRKPVLQEVLDEHHPDAEYEQHRYRPARPVVPVFDSKEVDAKWMQQSTEGGADTEDDFYVLHMQRPHFKHKSPPIVVTANNYADLVAEEGDHRDHERDPDTDFNDEREELLATGGDAARPWNGSAGEEEDRQETANEDEVDGFEAMHTVRDLLHRQSVWQRLSHERRNRPLRRQRQQRRLHQDALKARNLALSEDDTGDGIEGDTFQYEDFDFEPDAPAGRTGGGGGGDSQYSDASYEDADYADYRNTTSLSKEKSTPEVLIPRHRRIYSKWSRWTKCSPKCTTRRYKKCRVKEQCGREVLREIAYCYTEGSFCQQWLQAQVQKSAPYELRPVAASRRRDINYGGSDGVNGGTQSNAIVSDFIMNGKGYRGPEYAPLKLRCGVAPIRSYKRSMYNMLKIIGGKAARKGEWPWQVAIFNRFKEAFCGGTLIAPQWVLTAAHCVRKVLHVRIGEHNLDYEDGTELQLRVLKSFKHPNFDKKTVDSDVALLKLPKLVNATTWIGFSCLPRPYQPLPKSMECTVIGWGKRRNRDVAGTSVLHQAEVPIIPMDNCRSVYHDYTITKNMFCAGHRRGRIDTCAGDSGGPLLCRDTTKPNHPWTIFGITSFGDGCAKRNKFGIYAKVPNYVDWVWSVVNCNGNCKQHQRSYIN